MKNIAQLQKQKYPFLHLSSANKGQFVVKCNTIANVHVLSKNLNIEFDHHCRDRFRTNKILYNVNQI